MYVRKEAVLSSQIEGAASGSMTPVLARLPFFRAAALAQPVGVNEASYLRPFRVKNAPIAACGSPVL